MKVMALDYGSARTGVAVSDPTGVIARPLCVIERVRTDAGSRQLVQLVARGGPGAGDRRPAVDAQRRARRAGARDGGVRREAPRASSTCPVLLWDERFTTDLAQQTPSTTSEDARAAAHLLSGYLAWSSDAPA